MSIFQGLLNLGYIVYILASASLIVTVLYHELRPRSTEEFR